VVPRPLRADPPSVDELGTRREDRDETSDVDEVVTDEESSNGEDAGDCLTSAKTRRWAMAKGSDDDAPAEGGEVGPTRGCPGFGARRPPAI
jgi:hypothetical protein